MTLAEMASFVCTKVRETDEASVAACKNFIRQRFEMIYNSQLWRESVGMVSLTVDPTATDLAGLNAANGIVHMPALVDRVLAIRSADREMVPELPEVFFRMDYDAFSQQGTPSTYHILSKAVLTFPAARRLYIGSWLDADIGSAYYLRWTDGNNVPQNEAGTIVQNTTDALFKAHAATFKGGNEFVSATSIEMWTKAVTNDQVWLASSADVNDPNSEIGIRLYALETTSTPVCRIQLVAKPTVSTALRVLCKKRLVPLTNDNDTLCLSNADNCVLAFAQADMLERGRQYGKAQLINQEGMGLLESLVKMSTVQEASNRRVIPVCENDGPTEFQTQKGDW